MRNLLFCLLVVTAMTSCSSEEPKLGAHSHPAPPSQSARITEIKWHNGTYTIGELLTADEIGKEIGNVESVEITCPPGAKCGSATPIHKGDKLYDIKGVDTQKAIAGKGIGGIYYKLIKRQR